MNDGGRHAPFKVVLFRDRREGEMLGIVFEEKHHVAVFNLDKQSRKDIAFGSNSWRGDDYEPYLRRLRGRAATGLHRYYPVQPRCQQFAKILSHGLHPLPARDVHHL